MPAFGTLRRSCATRPSCSTITRPAEAIVSGRWATMMRVSFELADRLRSPRARARRRARWSPRRGTGSAAACRARAPAGCAAAARRTGWCPCRRPACCSPSASPRSRRAPRRGGRTARPSAVSACGVEEADVVGDRAGEELVVLHHGADHVAPGAQARAAASGTPPTGSRPACGAWMPSISFSSVVLPQPDGPTIATDSPGSIAQAQPAQHAGLGRRSRRSATSRSSRRRRRLSRGAPARRPPARASASTMSASRSPCSLSILQLDHLVDQAADALRELLLVGDEREQHADREALSSTSSAPSQIDRHALEAEHAACAARANIRSSLRVAMSAFIASTTRFMKRACRSSWRLNSLIDCTPRTDSRKWLGAWRSWTIASSVASRSGRKKAQRSSA